MDHDDPPPGMLTSPLPALDDAEAERVPPGLPPVVDAHVHLFPEGLFTAIWSWFDRHGWPVRYRLSTEQLATYLQGRGVTHVVALHYAHRPGVARDLNRQMAELCQRHGGVTGLATVFPGEDGATAILEQAFAMGLRGVKLHAHVQCFELESEAMDRIYDCCAASSRPLVMHAGREPKSPAYACDPYQTCGAARVRRVLDRHSRLKLCVPHLGADEFEAFRQLQADHDNLWLDTTMALASYLPGPTPPPLAGYRSDRLLYGSDFPNIPYDYDLAIKSITSLPVSDEVKEKMLWRNAARFYGLEGIE